MKAFRLGECVVASLTLMLLLLSTAGCARLSGSDLNRLSLTVAQSPLPADAFNATIEPAYSVPVRMKAGAHESVNFVVTNSSRVRWPSFGATEGNYRIRAGNHWLDTNNMVIDLDNARGSLPYDLEPGEKAEILLPITAPEKPGDYILEVDVVQEGVAWFAQRGSTTFRSKVTVEENR
jgi:hypothetical protein